MHRLSLHRALVALGTLSFLTHAAWAQTPQPAPGADSPYEYQVVSTASRKMLEVQRETDQCVVNAVPKFLRRVAPAYRTKAPVMYGAMEAAGKVMAGRGPRCTSMSRTLYHVTGAASFYKYNVSDDWKKKKAQSLSTPGKPVTWDAPEVFAAWEDDVTDGKDLPADMLLPDSVALPALSWVTPDEQAKVAGAATRDDGTKKFFQLCELLSLAPEWYTTAS